MLGMSSFILPKLVSLLIVAAILSGLCIEKSSAFQCAAPCMHASRRRKLDLHASLIFGLNKYSHDASCCVVDSETGNILFSQAKERVTGRKHDGGSIGSLVRFALNSIGGRLQDVSHVVSNNHHFRVLPYEHRIPFYKALMYAPGDYDDSYNLLSHAKHYELSHHLAHAWSVVPAAPFDKGLVLVMDGMGESYGAMVRDMAGVEEHGGDYMHDLKLLKAYGTDAFIGQPLSLLPGFGYREAETAYVFDRQHSVLRPVFKRWTRERSPPELYNHGFENMESLGEHSMAQRSIPLHFSTPFLHLKRAVSYPTVLCLIFICNSLNLTLISLRLTNSPHVSACHIYTMSCVMRFTVMLTAACLPATAGAVYSRVASYVLGDWNACGKIMGLAPWAGRRRADAKDWYFKPPPPSSPRAGQRTTGMVRKADSQSDMEGLGLGHEFHHKHKFMKGNLVRIVVLIIIYGYSWRL